MFFNFNDEKRIGFKKMSTADLGISSSSRQTHIGLYEGVLNFLDNVDVVKSAMLIYNTYCDILDCTFDRIENPDGTYRSPKIRIGEDTNNSVVSKIREFVKQDTNADWYLAWCGLESEELVFWLIKGGTEDYEVARHFFIKDKMVLDHSASTFNSAKDYLLHKINFTSLEIQRDIEVKSQLGDLKRIYRGRDIENAAKQFKQIGIKGEELIAQYLEKEKTAKRINSFVWENKSFESGLPYDFIINDKLFVDVKSTRFDFNQYLFYSNQEIDFASSQDGNSYSVYRVYDMEKEEKKLQICYDCYDYMQSIKAPISVFRSEMEQRRSLLQTLKLGVMPNDCFKSIEDPIIL